MDVRDMVWNRRGILPLGMASRQPWSAVEAGAG